MTEEQSISNRVEELETKLMFQDELIEQLNQSLITQHKDIKLLMTLIERMSAQLEDAHHPDTMDASQEPPPPHY